MKTIICSYLLMLGMLITACNTSESLTDKKATPSKNTKLTSKVNTSDKQDSEIIDTVADRNLSNVPEIESIPTQSVDGNETPTVNADKTAETKSTQENKPSAMEFMTTEDLSMRATSSRAKQPRIAGNKASMSFEDTNYDFGNINTGEKVTHVYKFTNNGNAPLIIHNATSTCGCTVPEIPLEPIAPGDTGSILVHYDSTGKVGSQNKTVTIQTNGSPPIYYVYFKALVVTESKEDKADNKEQE